MKNSHQILASLVVGFVLACILEKVHLPKAVSIRETNPAVFTPYFPGLEQISTHEVFDPKYRNFKKIVFLGGSDVDAIGCDKTWSTGELSLKGKSRNAHWKCSIAHSLQKTLDDSGVVGWKVFNLARNGALVIDMYDVYFKIRKLKPEIIVLGLGSELIDGRRFLSQQLKNYKKDFPEEIQKKFEDTMKSLKKRYVIPPDNTVENAAIDPDSVVIETRGPTIQALLIHVMNLIKRAEFWDSPPRVPEIVRSNLSIEKFKNTDLKEKYKSDFELLKLVDLIDEVQKLESHKLIVFQPASFEKRSQQEFWVKYFTEPFAKQLNSYDIPFLDLSFLDLKAGLETYDGKHNTLYGNQKIAKSLFEELNSQGYLKDFHYEH